MRVMGGFTSPLDPLGGRLCSQDTGTGCREAGGDTVPCHRSLSSTWGQSRRVWCIPSSKSRQKGSLEESVHKEQRSMGHMGSNPACTARKLMAQQGWQHTCSQLPGKARSLLRDPIPLGWTSEPYKAELGQADRCRRAWDIWQGSSRSRAKQGGRITSAEGSSCQGYFLS